MFRRTNEGHPKSASFEADLTALGLKRNEAGQYVHVDPPHDFYTFRVYQDANTNELRSEAIHNAIRKDVLAELAVEHIEPRYLLEFKPTQGADVVHVDTTEHPGAKCIKILATSFQYLNDKKEILLFVGDSKQQLGILSWEKTTTASGINGGTALGFVKALRAKTVEAASETLDESDVPGVIILNPGELLYSHQSDDCMSAAEWQNRERLNAFSEPFAADPDNKIPAHESAKEHIHTFLHKHLHMFVRSDQRLHIITIGDAGAGVLSGLNNLFTQEPKSTIIKSLKAIAMIQSNHDYDLVKTFTLQRLLLRHGRAWESSLESKGTILAKPSTEVEHAIFDEEDKQRRTAPEDDSTYKFRHDVLTRSQQGLESSRTFMRPRAKSGLVAVTSDSRKLDAEWKESNEPTTSDSFEHFMGVTIPRRLEKIRQSREEYKDTDATESTDTDTDVAGAKDPDVVESQTTDAPQQQHIGMDRPEFDRTFKFPASASASMTGPLSKTSSKSSLSSGGVGLSERQLATHYLTRRPENSRPESLVDLGELPEKMEEHGEEVASADAGGRGEGDTDSDEHLPQVKQADTLGAERVVMQHHSVPASPVIPTASSSADPDDEALDLPASLSGLEVATATPEGNTAGVSSEGYAYYDQPHNCTTVSAGFEAVCEDIFPGVMDDVLDFLANNKEF